MHKLILLLLLFTLPIAGETLVNTYEEAVVKSKESDSLIPYGSAEHTTHVNDFERHLNKSISTCFDKESGEFPEPFEIVFVIGKSGDVLKTYQSKKTEFGDCFVKELLTGKFQEPSISPLYARASLTFSH